jgi:hypothetical protein
MELKYKFRALTKDNKKWVYGLPIYDYRCVAGKSESVLCMQESSNTTIKMKYEILPETLNEFTGRLDIYEKDIVEGYTYLPSGTRSKIQGIVKNINYAFVVEGIKSSGGMSCFLIGLYDAKVLGNTTDNPELLQEVERG